MSLSFLRVCCVGSALLLAGCISGEEGIANTSDSLVGISMFKDGAPPPMPDGFVAPLVDGGDPRFDAAPTPCQPGTRVGPCSLCGPAGQLEMPDDDAQCPVLNCGGGQGQYERIIEGDETICFETMGAPRLPGRCASLGRCATEQEYCGDSVRMEIARGSTDPCSLMEGCEGIQPPETNNLPAGTECNRIGICRPNGNGGSECTVQVPAFCRLDDTPDAKFFCENGLENGRRYCEYFVEPPNDGRTRCVDFCQSLDMVICDQNAGEQCCWNNSTATNCERVEGIICDGMPCNSIEGCRDMICRCYIPNDP
jgi:hypothetical protein